MSMLGMALRALPRAFAHSAGASAADGPRLGKPISPADIAPWDITIMPDGTGLPAGNGTPAQGAPIFQAKCSACHGENGKGGVAAAGTARPPPASPVRGKTIAELLAHTPTNFA